MKKYTEHPKPAVKVGVLFLRRKRPGFLPEWGEIIEKQVKACLKTVPFEIYFPAENIVDSTSLMSVMKECNGQGCDVYVVIQPTMADGRMSPVLAQMSKAPVVLWATPEKQDGSMISSCSLVGAHTFASNLAQSNHPFNFVYGSPEDKTTVKALEEAVYRSYAQSKLTGAYVGMVGYHAPGFIDMHMDPATLSTIDMELMHIGMHEFIDSVYAVSDEDAKKDLKKVQALGLEITDDITEDDLLLASRYYLAMKALMDNIPLQALSVRDWPELSAKQWPYLAMARLATEGYAISCEGDGDGAICCLAAYLSGCGAAYLSDWLEHDEHHITLWHGGAAPLQMCQGLDSKIPPNIGRHFNVRNPAVVNASLKEDMPITVFRIWHLNGQYFCSAIEGRTVKPKRNLKGTNGLGFFPDTNINDYFVRMIKMGYSHHPIVVEGHKKDHFRLLTESMGMIFVD